MDFIPDLGGGGWRGREMDEFGEIFLFFFCPVGNHVESQFMVVRKYPAQKNQVPASKSSLLLSSHT